MKSRVFGSLVAGAVTSLFLAGAAIAADDAAPMPKAADDTAAPKVEKKEKKHDKKDKGWCKSNECSGKIEGAKNGCKGKQACKGVDKDKCEASGAGTWMKGKAPKA